MHLPTPRNLQHLAESRRAPRRLISGPEGTHGLADLCSLYRADRPLGPRRSIHTTPRAASNDARGARSSGAPLGFAGEVRGALGRAAQAGFTLIEMMIVTVVIMVVAVIAFSSFSMYAFESAFERFADDLHGAFVRARDLAVDRQTTTELRITSGQVQLLWTDVDLVSGAPSATFGQQVLLQTWDKTMYGGTQGAANGLLANDARACILGVIRGVQVPSQVTTVAWPNTCMSATTPVVIQFNPAGEMTMVGQDLAGSGVTLVLADRRDSAPTHTVIEAWPGGLIRKYSGVL